MHDTARVRERDDVTDAIEQAQAILQRGQPSHAVREPVAGDERHDVVRAVVRQPSALVDGDDARMFEGREDPRFAAETFVVHDAGQRRHFDRDVAFELAIARAIDRSHAAAADLFQQLVLVAPRSGQSATCRR